MGFLHSSTTFRMVWQTAYDRIFRVRQIIVCIYFHACKRNRVWMICCIYYAVRLSFKEVGRITVADILCWPCAHFGAAGGDGGGGLKLQNVGRKL
jgi:hypothetical protein